MNTCATNKGFYIIVSILVIIFNISISGAEYITIANDVYTNNRLINIRLDVSDSGIGISRDSKMCFSNDKKNGNSWIYEKYSAVKTNWNLLSRQAGGTNREGVKNVYVKVSDGLGNWMSTPLFLSLIYDVTSPYVTEESPRANQIDVISTSQVSFTIKDDLAGLNPESLSLKINGLSVSPTLISSNDKEIHVVYTPSSPFKYGSQVSIEINCDDKVGNSQTLTYSFFVEQREGDFGTDFASSKPWGNSENWTALTPELWKVSSDVDENLVYEVGRNFPDPDKILLYEDFNQDIFPGVFETIDLGNKGGPSDWYVNNGVLIQAKNIMGRSEKLKRLGTIFCAVNGNTWTDYSFSIDMMSKDNDSIGVIFRYADNNNFYRFFMDKQRKICRLEKIVNGTTSFLDKKIGDTYERKIVYHIRVEIVGSAILIYRDNELLLQAEDNDISHGGVGLYTWANQANYFDNLVVRDFTSSRTTPNNDLKNLVGLEYSIYESESYGDFTMDYKSVSFGGNHVAIFGYANNNNYYRVNFPTKNLIGEIMLDKIEGGQITRIANSSKIRDINIGETNSYTVSAVGGNITVSINGITALETSETPSYGKIGLGSILHKAHFDDIHVSSTR